MSVTTERLPGSMMQLEIEVDPGRVETSKNRAVKRLAQRVRIPGFRPGKAPRQIIERTLGDGALLQEALEELLPEVYNEALETTDVQAIDQPEFDLKSADPLVVIARVPVRPTIDLGDYQQLRAPRPEPAERPELLEQALTDVRRRYATLEPVDRAVQWDDTVRADVTVSIDGQDEPHEEHDVEFAVRSDSVVSLPGFLDHLIGLDAGRTHEFSFVLPDGVGGELAGKSAHYSVTLHEVKQEVLPELDDEFVRSLDEAGIETVEQLTQRLQDNIQARLQADLDAQYQEEVVDLLVASSTIEYPEVLVEREVDRMIDEMSNHRAHTREDLDGWLRETGRDETELRASLRERAELSVRRGLVLGEFGDAEGIEVPEEDVTAEIEKSIDSFSIQIMGDSASDDYREQLRGLLDTEQTRRSTRNQLFMARTLERLAEICGQDIDESEAPARARGTRRRRRRDDEVGDSVAETADAGNEADAVEPIARGDDPGEQSAASTEERAGED